jgi:hypothetical protein
LFIPLILQVLCSEPLIDLDASTPSFRLTSTTKQNVCKLEHVLNQLPHHFLWLPSLGHSRAPSLDSCRSTKCPSCELVHYPSLILNRATLRSLLLLI